MTICTDAFVGLAREESKNLGMLDLPLVIIKHPIGGESPSVIHDRAEDALAQVIHALTSDTSTRPATPAVATAPATERLTFVRELKLRAMYKAASWPDWVDQHDDEALCPIVGKPEDIHIVVTGDRASTPPSSRPSAPRSR